MYIFLDLVTRYNNDDEQTLLPELGWYYSEDDEIQLLHNFFDGGPSHDILFRLRPQTTLERNFLFSS